MGRPKQIIPSSQVRHSKRQPWNLPANYPVIMENHGFPFWKSKAEHWSSIFASHTFHEIQMYYPMRVYRDKKFKLIWNIAHPLPYPLPRIYGQRVVFGSISKVPLRTIWKENCSPIHTPSGIRILQDRQRLGRSN